MHRALANVRPCLLDLSRAALITGLLGLLLTSAGRASASGSERLVPESIAFWNRTRGLAVFTSVDRCPGIGCAAIGVTADGGRTWRLTYRGRSATELAVAPGTHDGWLAAGGCTTWWSCRPPLLRSHDGGLTWHTVGRAVLNPTFPTPTIGVGALYDANGVWSLVHTHDYGRHWSRLRSPCGATAQYLVPSFITSRVGWVLCAGQPGAGHQLKAIFRTRDGGRGWHLVMNTGWTTQPRSATPGGIPDAGYANRLAFSSSRGWVGQSEFFSYTSPDGGRTWRPVDFGFSPTAGGEIEDVSAVTGRTAYALARLDGGRRRELLRTTDAGRSWQIVHTWRYS